MDASQIQWDSHDPATIKWDAAPTPDPTGSAAFNPAAGQSTGGNLAAGIGQGMTDVGTGMQQMAAHNPFLAATLNPAMLFSSDKRKAADQEATDKAKTDAPLLDTTAGKIGSVVGNAAVTAPLPTAEISALGKVGNAIFKGLQQGGESGAVQPVANASDGPSVASLVDGNKSPSYLQQKVGQIGEGAAFGAGVGGAMSGAGSIINRLVSPSNTAATISNTLAKVGGQGEVLGSAAKSDFAKEGEDLVRKTGVNLTPGEISGNKMQIALENNARQSLFSRNLAFSADKTKTQQLYDHVANLIDSVAPSGGDPAAVGQRVQGAVNNAVKTISDDRAAQAAQDYGVVNQLAKGANPIVPKNYLQTLNAVSQDLAGAPKQSDLGKIGQSVASLQSQGMQNADLPTLLKTRQFLSQVSGGQKLASGASDASIGQQKRIAAQLLDAINTDFDQSSQQVGGNIGEALRTANANYAKSSQQIEGIKKMALGKLVGEDLSGFQSNTIPGESVLQKMQTMKPSELDASVRLLQDHDPDTLQAVKRSVLESALNKAQQMAPSEGENTIAMHPNVLVNALAKTPEDEARLRALFSPQEQSQINDALKVARRMSDKTGFNASGTANNLETGALAGALFSGNVPGAIGIGGKMLTSRGIASIMANPEGRAMVQQLNRLPPGSGKARELTAQIAAIAGAQSVDQPAQASQ